MRRYDPDTIYKFSAYQQNEDQPSQFDQHILGLLRIDDDGVRLSLRRFRTISLKYDNISSIQFDVK